MSRNIYEQTGKWRKLLLVALYESGSDALGAYVDVHSQCYLRGPCEPSVEVLRSY